MVLGHPGWREMSKTPLAALQTRIGPAWPEDARSSSAKRRVAGWVARGCWDYFYDSYYRSFPHSPKKAPLSLLVGGAITILKIICVYIYIYVQYCSGWWLTRPSEKWWTSSVGMIMYSQYMESHEIHVPNHQPVMLQFSSGWRCDNNLEKYEFVNGKDYPIYYGK